MPKYNNFCESPHSLGNHHESFAMLALTGTTGKIGGAVLNSILRENLVPPNQLVICTSSDPNDARWDELKSKGTQVRLSKHEDPESMIKAFSGCSKLFLVSTPAIAMDFNNPPLVEGREKSHIAAIKAAQKAGVKHIYYTSLAFGNQSNAGVMQAHLRTEAFLHDMKDTKFTIIREGLYNESWPLYLGYYDLNGDDRTEIVIAGDGPISWTSIADLGHGTALILEEQSDKYEGKTFYLTGGDVLTLKDIAKLVSTIKGKQLTTKVVSREEYVEFYTQRGIERPSVEWWSTTYAALEAGECIPDDLTLVNLLRSKGRELESVQKTIQEMLSS